jgi:hypothetical protein
MRYFILALLICSPVIAQEEGTREAHWATVDAHRATWQWFDAQLKDGLLVDYQGKGSKPYAVFSEDFYKLDEAHQSLFLRMTVKERVRGANAPKGKNWPAAAIYVGDDVKTAKKIGTYHESTGFKAVPEKKPAKPK